MPAVARAPLPAPAAVAVALAAALLAAGAAHHGQWAAAQAPPSVELLHAGAAVAPPLVELHASPEPAELELVARGVGGGAVVSARVVRHSHWGSAAGEAPPAVRALVDHGGEATLVVDRSSPGELVLEAAASGTAGNARALYVVRVLDALPPPGSPDRAAPSHIVGHVDPDDPALTRMLAQAGRPLCADTSHAADVAALLGIESTGNADHWSSTHGYISWEGLPMLSGVPPIEGMSPGSGVRAMFGQQTPQWVYLDRIDGPDRVRYYLRDAYDPDHIPTGAMQDVRNPYTNESESYTWPPRAAAPGPYWGDRSRALWHGVADLYLVMNGTLRHVVASVNATNSLVPELLPLDGKAVILATAFHADAATFSILGPPGRAFDHLALEPPPGVTHALVNGTEVPLGPGLSATVRVSDIARQNGILIGGITDGEDARGMTVKTLHEITLAAELPVDVGDAGLYARVGEGMSVAPWECWPRLGGGALVP